MSAPTVKSVGMIAHTGKPGAADLVKKLCAAFASRGVSVRLEKETTKLLADATGRTSNAGDLEIAGDESASLSEAAPCPSDLGKMCDLLVVLGGDGTILQVVHDLGDAIKPIFGINLGSLGFLTCVSSTTHVQAVDSIVAGSYVLSHRTLLAIEVERDGQIVAKRLGLNDVVISRGELSRLIKLQTRINNAVLTEYNADGLVISTPTGSTAYSLAAGGPILTPDCGVFVITPICPHVLTNRSIIVGDNATVDVRPCRGEQDVFLTVDGQELVRIRSGDVIRIRKASVTLPLAVLPEMSFFEVLRQKLKWSGSAI